MSMKSLATSTTDYVQIQARRESDNSLHIQGKGPETNRKYGVAVSVSCPANLAAWFLNQKSTPKNSSLHKGSDAQYLPAQATIRGNSVHIQVKGSNFNRAYGAAFNIDNNGDLRSFVAAAQQEVKTQAEAEAEAQAMEVKAASATYDVKF